MSEGRMTTGSSCCWPVDTGQSTFGSTLVEINHLHSFGQTVVYRQCSLIGRSLYDPQVDVGVTWLDGCLLYFIHTRHLWQWQTATDSLNVLFQFGITMILFWLTSFLCEIPAMGISFRAVLESSAYTVKGYLDWNDAAHFFWQSCATRWIICDNVWYS